MEFIICLEARLSALRAKAANQGHPKPAVANTVWHCSGAKPSIHQLYLPGRQMEVDFSGKMFCRVAKT